MKRDDTLWKAILEDIFDDFLLFFFKEKAELFDLEKGFAQRAPIERSWTRND